MVYKLKQANIVFTSLGWQLFEDVYACDCHPNRKQLRLIHEDNGVYDYPILAPSGTVLYDRPENIPYFIKEKIAEYFLYEQPYR